MLSLLLLYAIDIWYSLVFSVAGFKEKDDRRRFQNRNLERSFAAEGRKTQDI